ncbi:MAG: DUF1844 domain-containing protein [Planctomycetota bacterium]|jgi:hypothetical protein|nr:DUF1844 domain-containing protein [Planctomycetota bacterium]
MADMTEDGKREIEASFMQFINGLGVQTLAHLGKMSNPISGKIGLDLPNAKYSIDLLGIIQEKTKGNLSPGEDKYLADILRDLRLDYVETLRQAKGGAAEAEKAPDASGAAASDKV